ncbi:MAG TPA: COX15/CtaA family protein [Bryobacteraceae bacterium]|nr:COX15/CtaA family protein [Bryobacteraceae bacterium]
MYRVWLHRYAVVVAVCTLLLLVAGGLVASNEAGLSVDSWPLVRLGASPATPGATYELVHRAVASVVGLLTLGLAIWLWRVERRRWMRWLGVTAAIAVVGQGILGGVGIRWALPQSVSVMHAILAGLFFAITVAIAVFTSRSWLEVPRPETRLFPLAVVVSAVLLVQLALGAAVRHDALGVGPHILSGSVAGALGLWAVWRVLVRYGAHTELRRSALALLTLGVCQAMLGMGAYLSRVALMQSPQPPPGVALMFTVSHVAAGAAALAAAVVLAIYASPRAEAA